MAERIVIEFDEAGNCQVEAVGVLGPSCRDLTRAIERAIGQTVKDQKTPDFHRPAPRKRHSAQGGGGRVA